MIRLFRAVFSRDPQANRIVPPSGFTAWLTVFSAAAMAFLAALALALSLTAARTASAIERDLAASVTLRLPAELAQSKEDIDRAIRIVGSMAGVRSARALDDAAQRALLSPWLGGDIALEDLPVPRLIVLDVDPDSFDASSVRLRLAAEMPDAVLNDHGRWRQPVGQAAQRLRWLGVGAAVLITAALAAIVTLAVQSSLAANAQIIQVLRLVGALDSYIAGAFARRFTQRAMLGAAFGAVCGVISLMLLPAAEAGQPDTVLSFRPQGLEWAIAALIPFVAGAVALLATLSATARMLKELP